MTTHPEPLTAAAAEPPAEPLVLGVDPSPKWIRARIGGAIIIDSLAAVQVHEPGKAVGFYAVPRADVIGAALVDSAQPLDRAHAGASRYLDLVTEVRLEAAAWAYETGELAGLVGLRWDAFDQWFEEDEEVFIHPRSPYHRVDALPSDRHVVVRDGQRVLAETTRPVAVFETGMPVRWYIPEADITRELFVDVDLRTGCSYKGFAGYRALADQPDRPLQWYYAEPNPAVGAIAGHVAFFDELVDVVVDGQPAGRPTTQFSYGLRDNTRGGGSGAHQGNDSASDHPDHTPRKADHIVTDTHENTVNTSLRHPVPEGELTWAPSQRHVRGTVGEVTVVDSLHPVLVWEPGGIPVPRYAFAAEEVRTDLLEPAQAAPRRAHPGAVEYYDLVIDGERRPGVAWRYGVGDLAGLLGFDWFLRREPGVDHWFEEDEEIFVHPRDPYKRIDALRSSRHVTVSINGVQVAETTRPVLLFETRMPTRYYIPAEDVDFTQLQPTELHTGCPYKGTASYWSFTGATEAGTSGENIVWSYPEPLPAVGTIAGLLSFYNEHVDITVDGQLQPRPEAE